MDTCRPDLDTAIIHVSKVKPLFWVWVRMPVFAIAPRTLRVLIPRAVYVPIGAS